MQCNKEFKPLEIVLSNPEVARLLASTVQVQMPTNLPPQLQQTAYERAMQQIRMIAIPPVDYECFLVALESTRGKSERKAKGMIIAARQPNGTNVSTNVVQLARGWTFSRTS